VAENTQGRNANADELTARNHSMIIEGTRRIVERTINGKHQPCSGTFRTNPEASPSEFDFDFDGQAGIGGQRGLFEFDGPRLRLIYRSSNTEKPRRAQWSDKGQSDVAWFEFERADAADRRPSGMYLAEFQKDQGWSFVYEFSGSTMQRRFVKTPGTAFKPIGGEAAVQSADGGGFLLIHKDRGEHELWQPGEQAGTFKIQRGDAKSYLTNPLKGTARQISRQELQQLTGTPQADS
jgi:uncharacterized protein (TIGR03067 family)